MQMPSTDPDTLCEDLWHDVPSETIARADACKACTRARNIKTPQHLLRGGLLYCGLDQSLREVAGTRTLLGPRLTESAIAERLAACRPWIKALRPKMVAHRPVTSLPPDRRFIVMDGSPVQAPGAPGIPYRLHLGVDLVTLEFTQVHISAAKTGERLRRFALGPDERGVAARGYWHPTAVAETGQAGAHLVVRLHPSNRPLSQPDDTPLDLIQALQPQAPCTLRSLPGRVGPTSQRVTGWVHADRLREEPANKARAVGRQRNSTKGHTPQASTLFLAGGGLVGTSLPPDILRAETLLHLYRVRWHIALAIKRCKSLRDLDALRARQGRPVADLWRHGQMLYGLLVDPRMRRPMGASGGDLDRMRPATWWRPWKLGQQTLIPRRTGALHWADPRWRQGVDVMAERPRRRPLQRLPEVLVAPPSWVDSDLLALGEEEWEEPIAA